MAAQAEIKAVITADDRASKELSKFGGSLGGVGNMGKVAAAGLAVAGAAAVAFGIESTKAYMDSENTLAQLNAVIKSTGGVAGVSSKMATDLASSLQKVTRFSDEAILSGENMLLTFTNIGKDIFPQATETILDMSQALGQDLKSSAIQLGKALNDPISGVTALRRVGVQFSDAQEAMIKKLVESGDLMGAQKLILAELRKEFGDSSKAAGETFAGKIDILKNSFNDLMERIGGAIAQYVQPFIQGAITLLDQFQSKGVGAFGTVGRYFSEFFAGMMLAANWLINTFGPVIMNLWKSFVFYVVPAFQALWNDIQNNLLPALKEFWTWAGPILTPVLKFIAAVMGGVVVGAILLLAGALRMITYLVTVMVQNFNNGFAGLMGWIAGVKAGFAALPGFINAVFSSVYNFITKPFRDAFNFIRNINWGAMFGNIAKMGGNAIVGLIEGSLNAALSGIPGVPKIRLPRFANGVENFRGGMAIVGERGPEIVTLPRGSSVIPNHQIGTQVSSPTTINVNISGAFMGSQDEARAFAKKIISGMQDLANAQNTSVAELLG